MSHRSPSSSRSWLLAAALAAANGGAASTGRAQQVAGSIGASLTILEPVVAPTLRVTRFGVEGDGIAVIETTLPSSARASPFVVVRVACSTTEPVPNPQPAMFVVPASGVRHARHVVRGADGRGPDRARPTALRLDYLIVAAGT